MYSNIYRQYDAFILKVNITALSYYTKITIDYTDSLQVSLEDVEGTSLLIA